MTPNEARLYASLDELTKKYEPILQRQAVEDSLQILTTRRSYADLIRGMNYRRLSRKINRLIKLCMLLLGAGLLVVSIVFALISTGNPYVDRFARKHIQPLAISASKFLRRHTFPLHGLLPLSDLLERSCLISNPLYVPSVDTNLLELCDQCTRFHQIFEADGRAKDKKRWDRFTLIEGSGFPLVLRKSQEQSVSFSALQLVYRKHPEHLLQAVHAPVYSTNRTIQSLQLLFSLTENEIIANEHFHASWESIGVSASHVFRRMFPKSRLINPDIEILPEKKIFVDSIESKPYTLLNREDVSGSWYTLGSGAREVVLTPMTPCSHICTQLTTKLTALDTRNFISALCCGRLNHDQLQIQLSET
ncbi:uncharacterized protein LOC141908900 isoform X2 [Tubulanus polymorphus]|uniref:uncharacterized protein LOC141908900 isoform X2 n=1 Tax=Tubulanus polymorphus TaxID=672921 RepID=UPI003DA579A8